jgi:hypothetical protein
MPQCRILYFRGGILEDSAELASGDLLDAAKTASSHHPDLMAEVWLDGRKAAVIRPSWRHLRNLPCATNGQSLPNSHSRGSNPDQRNRHGTKLT